MNNTDVSQAVPAVTCGGCGEPVDATLERCPACGFPDGAAMLAHQDAEPLPELDYAAAGGLVVEASRQEQAAKLAELRRQADAAKERARRAQARLDRAVVMLASTRPEREDWYEHPGALPRKQLLAAAKLNTMGLHRTMERYRRAAKRPGKR